MNTKTWLTITGATAVAGGVGYYLWRRQERAILLKLISGRIDPNALKGWVWPIPKYLGLEPEINAPFAEERAGDVTHGGVDIDFLDKALKANFVEPWASGNPNSKAWMPPYTPAIAISNGTVVQARAATKRSFPPYTSSGNFVQVQHTDGKTSSFYLHLSDLFVAKGDKVVTGQPVGIVSNDPGQPDAKGRFDLPAGGIVHLHFEVWVSGKRVDPNTILRKSKYLEVPNDVNGKYISYVSNKPTDRATYAQHFFKKPEMVATLGVSLGAVEML